MGGRRLPVAPRPFRDEALSSWLGRVACRYGLDAPAMAAWLAFPDDPFDAPRPPIDDVSPSLDQVVLWARAGAVDPGRLRQMTLAARHPGRPRAWFSNRGPAAPRPVIPRPPTPVCLACFDADRAVGHDGYCRASWLLAERCVCPAHGRILIDRCPRCHESLRVAFRLRDDRARPVCARCEGVLEGGGGEGDGFSDMTAVLLTMQTRIAATVDHACPYRRRLEEVIDTLWSPLDDPGASRPTLALWCCQSNWRLAGEARQVVGRSMPLRLLSVPFRALTLVALRDLFGEEVTALAGPPDRATWVLARAAFVRPPGKSPRAPASIPVRERRSFADYQRLAREILAHPDWVAAADLPERRRRRVQGRLINEALDAAFSPAAGVAGAPPRPDGAGEP